MITRNYNPSSLEVQFAEALCEMKDEISKKLVDYSITKIESNIQLDNPSIDLFLKDKDGDEHEIILKIIQKPDKII